MRIRLSMNKMSSFIFKLSKILFWATLILLVIFCTTILGIALLILAVIPLMIARILQFIKVGDDYEKLILYKSVIRSLFLTFPILIQIGLWSVFYPLAKYAPLLKSMMLLGMPLTKWVPLVSLVLALCMLGTLINIITHRIVAKFIIERHSNSAREACSEIIDGLIFWWVTHEVIKHIPYIYKHHDMLVGLSIEKWIKVSVLVLMGYNLITLFTCVNALLLHKLCQHHLRRRLYQYINMIDFLPSARYLVYYANGMAVSVNFMLSSLLLLLTWVFYFGSHLNTKESADAKRLFEYGKWTIMCVFIFSFLWLIKTLILVTWEAHTLYDRLQAQILSTSQKLYFLLILHPLWNLPHSSKTQSMVKDDTINLGVKCIILWLNSLSIFTPTHKPLHERLKHGKVANTFLRKALLDFDAHPTLDHLELATQFFRASRKLALLDDTYISNIQEAFEDTSDNREKLKRIILGVNHPTKSDDDIQEGNISPNTTLDIDKHRQEQSDWSLFVKTLPNINQEDSKEDIPLSEIQTWAVRALNKCRNLINTVSSAKEVVDCLDNIISWVLIGAIFLMWLLLTGLATTRVIALVASPLLAATFIFGESCKTLFQGILFVYVTHPIDVADLCFVDGKMLKVKTIGVWTTTFTKVDNSDTVQDLVIYSNRELASKTVTNYKTNFDWSDYAEFNLIALKKTSIQKHEEVVDFFKRHLDEEKQLPLIRSPDVTALAMENNTMLVIRLEYKPKITEDWTYFECFRLKDNLKGEFYMIMRGIIAKFETQYGKPEKSEPGNKKLSPEGQDDKLEISQLKNEEPSLNVSKE